LPVVSTRHVGIPDVVIEGKTGFLVEEGNYVKMAQTMIMLAQKASRAVDMGKAAHQHIKQNFSKMNASRICGRLSKTNREEIGGWRDSEKLNG
jgi:colanic acid/amylovoran biosynthesis glycosyltransferase